MSDTTSPLNMQISENIFIEQVKILYGNIRTSIIGVLLTAMISIWLLDASASHVTLIAWFGAHLLISLVRAIMSMRFSAAVRLEEDFNPRFWAWAYAITALFSGITWGSFPWLAMDTTSLVNTLVISLAVTGMIAASIGATASFLPVYLMFSIPSGCMIAAYFLAEGGVLAEISALFLLFLVVSIAFTISLNQMIRQSISQRFERDALLVDVKEKRREAEQANQDKSRFLASASHDLRQPLHALDLYLSSMDREQGRKKMLHY